MKVFKPAIKRDPHFPAGIHSGSYETERRQYMKKQIFSLLCAFVLVLAIMPMTVFAANTATVEING